MRLAYASAVFATASALCVPAFAGHGGLPPGWQKAKKVIAWLRSTSRQDGGETVTCVGPNGTTVLYKTATGEGRALASTVSVRLANKTTQYLPLQMTNYLNSDAVVEMRAVSLTGNQGAFSLSLELVTTTAPKANEVATYAGVVSVGAASAEVACSAVRSGAGQLSPQADIGTTHLEIFCMRAGEQPNSTALPVVSFQVARNYSKRLMSDLEEQRAQVDGESLPAYLVSQYALGKARIAIELDDGSVAGNIVAELKASGLRVPTNTPAGSPALYGMWEGLYKRFDAGRELKVVVDCYGF